MPAETGTDTNLSSVPSVRTVEPVFVRDGLHDWNMDSKRKAQTLKRLPIRGGNWNNGSNAGLAALNLNNARSNANSNIGFRPALSDARSSAVTTADPVRCKKDVCALAGSQNIEQDGRCAAPSLFYQTLFGQIVDFENLFQAAVRARKGKRNRQEVAAFFGQLEENLIHLQNELIWDRYETGHYRNFLVFEPKIRTVSALPFRDRVVQQAIVHIIEPLFDRAFIDDSYACRVGKGTHRGADKAQHMLRMVQRNHGKVFVLKADIARYFQNIDHTILKQLLTRRIHCQKTLALLFDIIDHSPGEPDVGIPIGNLTSQLCANIYLHELDWFAKHTLRAANYVRYMDDFIIVYHDKQQLHAWRKTIEQFLWEKLRLKTNHKTQVFPVAMAGGRALDFLGYRLYPTHRLLRKCSIKRIKKNLKKYRQAIDDGTMTVLDASRKLQSWIGHARHANSYALRKKLLTQPYPVRSN